MTVQRIYTNNTALKVTGIGYAPEGNFEEENKTITPDEQLKELLKIASLCNDSALEKDEQTKKWTVKGDPTEGALIVAAAKAGFPNRNLTNKNPA